MKKFRVHHIMCTNLFKGYGYNGKFCENMTDIVKWLHDNPDTKMLVVTLQDDICKNCPNLRENGFCLNGNNVHEKDLKLLKQLHISENCMYSYNELKQCASLYLTKDVFVDSCSNCEWFVNGVCRFEDFEF